MKYFVIFFVLVGFALTPYLVSNSFAICVINEDWSDAPCHSKRGENPSLNQMKRWWSQYYEFKGAEWMELKKQELVQAVQNGSLIEWKKNDPDTTRHNVYMYYFLMGYVPNEDGLFAEEYYGIRLQSSLKQYQAGIEFNQIHCGIDLVLVQKYDGTPICVTLETREKLIERGWTIKDFGNADTKPTILSGLQVDVTGQQQIRRGTTHDIVVDVTRDGYVVSDALVRITIEDYGENVIRDYKGRTDDSGRFVFSWEIPKSFDDIKTLLAYVDVTDDISAKTILFKFQVYCLPGETGCKVEGK